MVRDEKKTIEDLLWVLPVPEEVLIDLGYTKYPNEVFQNSYIKGERLGVFVELNESYLFKNRKVYKQVADYSIDILKNYEKKN